MIKSLSPYYITTPWVNPSLGFTAESYRLKIWVWSGDLSTPPSDANYEITKNNPEAFPQSFFNYILLIKSTNAE